MAYQIGEYRVQYGTQFLYHGINPRMPPGWVRLPGFDLPSPLTGPTTFSFLGPQGFIMVIRNINALGAPLDIEHTTPRDRYGQIVFPFHTLLTYWSFFASEPFRWNFRIRTEGTIVCTMEAWVTERFVARYGLR